VTEILTVAGPGADQLDWVARLYGQADPKYRDPAFLEHLFLRNPIGPSLHAFAVEGETPVGHICIVRTRARYGPEDLPAGKLEGLWVEASHRGRRAAGDRLVRVLLSKLYAFADDQGIELVHALATPHIGRIIGFTPLSPVGARSLVSVVSPRGVAGRALALAQRVVREAAAAPVRSAGLRPAVGRSLRMTRGTGTARRRSCACWSSTGAVRSCSYPRTPTSPYASSAGGRIDRDRAWPCALLRQRGGSHESTERRRYASSPGPALRVMRTSRALARSPGSSPVAI
jgi:hypothetical protein